MSKHIQQRDKLKTEQQNPVSEGIDRRSIEEILAIINNEDKMVAFAVEKVLAQVAETVRLAVKALKSEGRVIYMGAGTSGRLGVLDASEIPPTFSAPQDRFIGLVAGGREALVKSIEGAEDIPEKAKEDLKDISLGDTDLVIGIASSSTTTYVLEGLKYARKTGAATAFLICNPEPLSPVDVDVIIAVDIGNEILTGSTRMKSGTATKLILNSISTTAMIQLGKVYDNLMVDLMVTNKKLEDRGRRIISRVCEVDYDAAGDLLFNASGSVKTAIVMGKFGWDIKRAHFELDSVGGKLRDLLESK